MSGHSHWASIKHTKQATDAKRSQLFSKLARELTIAAKEGGADPVVNPRLRTVMEKAKEANMPSENVERAIKKATGGEEGQLEEMLVEAYGPGGVALLISAITDNKNRTSSEFKQILQRNGGKMVEGGAVRWLFERKGVIRVEGASEETELLAIEEGAEDFYRHNDILDIYTTPDRMGKLKERLEERGLRTTASLDWVPKEHATVNEAGKQALQRLFEELDNQEDVQDIYSTL